MVCVTKDWMIIFKKDIEKTNELQRQYEVLLKKIIELEKLSMTENKRKKIFRLIEDIRIKIDRVKKIDEKQVKLLLHYCDNYSSQYLT